MDRFTYVEISGATGINQHVWIPSDLLKWRYNWSTHQQQRHCDPWMDREGCVLECVFLLTDNQTHYDDSRMTTGFRVLMEWSLMSHFKRLIWMRVWHENHGTEQGKPCLSAGLRAGVVPSHLFLKSGQDRSILRAVLSRCALVKGPDNRQKDAGAGKPKC